MFEEVFLPLGIILSILAMILGSIFGLSFASESWNCHEYKEAPTKMIAGTCYVKQVNGKWFTFSSYIRATNINVGEDGK